MRKEVIIDIKEGKITSKNKDDVVCLKGQKLSEDSSYIDELSILIKSDEIGEKEFPLKIGGYDFKLYLGNFSDECIEDILIYGETGGSGSYVISNIYHYDDGRLLEVFNADTFSDKYKFKCRYLKGYKIEIICERIQKKYILDISNVEKQYLSDIYDMDGKIITDTDPTVSYINNVYPIKDLMNNLMKLETYQRILGINNANYLGDIESIVSIEENKCKVIKQYALSDGKGISELSRINDQKEEILSRLPEDSMFMNFNKFGGSNGFIKKDIDGDGQEEILCGYKYKGTQYLGAFREVNGTVKLLDSIEGPGYDISDLYISKLRQKGNENIIIGWRIGGIWSVLDILEFRDNKFVKSVKGDRVNYSKIELCDSNNTRGGKSIALWTHETGEAYKVQIYTLRGDNLEKTYREDKEYFLKVEEYYKNLINKSRETPQYLYYLIEAQCRAGKKREALENINRALKHPNPFPSVQELKRLKKSIYK